jgi:hypothetical protein
MQGILRKNLLYLGGTYVRLNYVNMTKDTYTSS